jgi:hypothetical protein
MKRKTEPASRTIEINRAPVLTLWASAVAERLGHDHDSALTLAKALAGLNAQSKGRRLGIFKPSEKGAKPKEPRVGQELRIELLGRGVPAVKTKDGVRAVAGDKAIGPASVTTYLERAFGDNLAAATASMKKLAASYAPKELQHEAFGLYEQFRPSVPSGVKGWGAKGRLDLDLIRSLSKAELSVRVPLQSNTSPAWTMTGRGQRISARVCSRTW